MIVDAKSPNSKTTTLAPDSTLAKKTSTKKKYVVCDPEERIRIVAAEASAELKRGQLQAEAMLTLRAGDNRSEPRPVGFDDIDISVLDSKAILAWTVVCQKVHSCINFRDKVVEWDVAGTKRTELRNLILDIRGMQKLWKKTPELVLGMGRLAQLLGQFHDFYEQLGACTSFCG